MEKIDLFISFGVTFIFGLTGMMVGLLGLLSFITSFSYLKELAK